jgi:putative toxin-antitoxin system antitoxin component (TIGR02293 family)
MIRRDMAHHDDSGTRSTSSPQRRRLGEILVAGGAITEQQLAVALAEQPVRKLPLGQTLLALGFTTDETMRQALSSQLGVPYIDLQNVIIDRSLASLVDRTFAVEHALFPVARIGQTLTVAMDDPTAIAAVDQLASQTGHAVTVVTSSHDAINRALVRLYDAPATRAPESSAPVFAPPQQPVPLPPSDHHTHGYVALLGLTTYELPELLRTIEGGLPVRVFDQFVEQTGLSADRVAELADISRRDLGKRREEGTFSRAESDRLVRGARVVGGAISLFRGDRATAGVWLVSGQPVLAGSVPLDLARTDLGAREVERVMSTLRTKNESGA